MSSSTFKTTLLLFLALSSLVHGHDGITCNHDEVQEQNPPGHLDIQEDLSSLEPGRRLQSTTTTYPQFRIYANYDNLAKTASASYTSYIRDLLAPAVISYYQSAIQVKYPVVGNLVISSSVRTLCSLNTPTDLINGVPADYAILYTSSSASNNILATSYNCQVASGTKRPIVASTTINSQMLRDANGDVIVHEKNTYLLMHEMMHTLGFSKSLYKYFIDANGNTLTGHIKSVSIGGSTHTVIDVASLTSKLSAFHGCATIPGAIMGESGDDSHWDKKLYLYELMQSGAIDGKRVSQFGLSLLEASGWYVIDYDYAEPYFYGQGQGCSFINLGQCGSNSAPFDEFCATSGRGCNYVGNAGGTCNSGSNMDNCKYYIPSDSYHCENSAAVSSARLPTIESYGRNVGSKCFTGSLSSSSNSRSSSSSTSFCFQYNCTVDATGNTQLQVLLGANNTVVCAQQGPMTVSGYSGSLTCPDPLTFCNTVGVRFCPRNCLGRGTCVNNQCQCNAGFTGVDCALTA